MSFDFLILKMTFDFSFVFICRRCRKAFFGSRRNSCLLLIGCRMASFGEARNRGDFNLRKICLAYFSVSGLYFAFIMYASCSSHHLPLEKCLRKSKFVHDLVTHSTYFAVKVFILITSDDFFIPALEFFLDF